jgi:hypothetical protein
MGYLMMGRIGMDCPTDASSLTGEYDTTCIAR